MQPPVSVIVPVFNGEKYLKAALNSVVSQTYKNIECIVIDDGSEDQYFVKNLVNQMRKEWQEIEFKYFRKSNGGVSSALNVGIENANGIYFNWLSHDDLLPKYKIEEQVKALLKQPSEKSITFGSWDHIDEHGNFIRECAIEQDLMKIESKIGPIERQLLNACTMLIPIELVKLLGGFDESLRYTQDYDIFLKMSQKKVKWIYTPGILCHTRLHINQDTRKCNIREEHDQIWRRIAYEVISSIQSDYNRRLSRKKLSRYLEFIKSQNLDGAIPIIEEKLIQLY